MTAKCGTCGAFQAGGKGQKGLCHLSPPAVLLAGVQPPRFAGGPAMPITVSAWPAVADTDWCCMWLKRGDPDDWQPASEPWAPPAPNPVGDIGTAAHPVQGIPAPAGFGTLLKPENRDPGSDTFVAKPIRVDHTESHQPSKNDAGTWSCAVCGLEDEFWASTACLPPAEPVTTDTPGE